MAVDRHPGRIATAVGPGRLGPNFLDPVRPGGRWSRTPAGIRQLALVPDAADSRRRVPGPPAAPRDEPPPRRIAAVLPTRRACVDVYKSATVVRARRCS